MRGFLTGTTPRIEHLERSDKRAAYELVREVFSEEDPKELKSEIYASVRDPKYLDYLKENYHKAELDFFIAKSPSGEMLGLIGTHLMDFDEDSALWITTFAVSERARGMGLGKKLLERVEEQAREQGKKKVKLYTNNTPRFESAQFLYEKYGYGIKKLWEGDVDGEFDTYLREKKLP